MNEQERYDDSIDRLVGQYLQSEEQEVDVEAILEGLGERRARRRIVRLAPRILAAAAVLLVVIALLAGVLRKPDVAPAPQPRGLTSLPMDLQEALQAELVTALRREVEAALRGARSSGEAVVSAGAAPLIKLAEANRRLPVLIDEAGAAVDRFLGMESPSADETQEENTQWEL
jgi:hypothetical protein